MIVSVPGYLKEHMDLPGSAQAQREIALGLAGMSPTCESLGDALADAAVSDIIRGAEGTIGATTWAAGRWADTKINGLPSPEAPTRYDS